jgi:ABC-type oligopeptide transport system ATPase subunit
MLLEVQNVRKYFPGHSSGWFHHAERCVKAVDDVSFSLDQGEHLGLVGESGSGKTTLGRLMLKLYPVDSGRILLEGRDIIPLKTEEMRPVRRAIQMVFQDPYSSLDPRYTVFGILKEALTVERRPWPRDAMISLMTETLRTVGLKAEILGRFPHEFSGGERQRIAIARALMMNPRLLILDEAVSSLDVLIQEQILELLKVLQEKYQVTYLFISHNLRVVKKICRRVAVMYKGRIVELGGVEQIFTSPLHPYTQDLLSAALDYRAVVREREIPVPAGSSLVDRGQGHFVVN